MLSNQGNDKKLFHITLSWKTWVFFGWVPAISFQFPGKFRYIFWKFHSNACVSKPLMGISRTFCKPWCNKRTKIFLKKFVENFWPTLPFLAEMFGKHFLFTYIIVTFQMGNDFPRPWRARCTNCFFLEVFFVHDIFTEIFSFFFGQDGFH